MWPGGRSAPSLAHYMQEPLASEAAMIALLALVLVTFVCFSALCDAFDPR
jgi:hypothetical protein